MKNESKEREPLLSNAEISVVAQKHYPVDNPTRNAYINGCVETRDFYQPEIEKRDKEIAELKREVERLKWEYEKLDDFCMKMNSDLAGNK